MEFSELFDSEAEVDEKFLLALETKAHKFCVVDRWTVHSMILSTVLFDNFPNAC